MFGYCYLMLILADIAQLLYSTHCQWENIHSTSPAPVAAYLFLPLCAGHITFLHGLLTNLYLPSVHVSNIMNFIIYIISGTDHSWTDTSGANSVMAILFNKAEADAHSSFNPLKNLPERLASISHLLNLYCLVAEYNLASTIVLSLFVMWGTLTIFVFSSISIGISPYTALRRGCPKLILIDARWWSMVASSLRIRWGCLVPVQLKQIEFCCNTVWRIAQSQCTLYRCLLSLSARLTQ